MAKRLSSKMKPTKTPTTVTRVQAVQPKKDVASTAVPSTSAKSKRKPAAVNGKKSIRKPTAALKQEARAKSLATGMKSSTKERKDLVPAATAAKTKPALKKLSWKPTSQPSMPTTRFSKYAFLYIRRNVVTSTEAGKRT